MNPSRKTKREDLEVMLQYRSRQQNFLVEERLEEKLKQLQLFVSQLADTPHGRAELEGRARRFGDCQRIEGETSGQFYSRLRHWLDRDIERPRRRTRSSERTGD